MSETDANLLVTRWQQGGATQYDMFLLLKQGGRIDPSANYEEWSAKLQDQGPLAAFPPKPAVKPAALDEPVRAAA